MWCQSRPNIGAKALFAIGLICAAVSPAGSRPASISSDTSNLVEFGLLQWDEERGEMLASFLITNKSYRPINALQIDCEYGFTVPGYPPAIQKISKRLEVRPPSDVLLRGAAALHFNYVSFGRLEPVEWVSGMTCKIGEVIYH